MSKFTRKYKRGTVAGCEVTAYDLPFSLIVEAETARAADDDAALFRAMERVVTDGHVVYADGERIDIADVTLDVMLALFRFATTEGEGGGSDFTRGALPGGSAREPPKQGLGTL